MCYLNAIMYSRAIPMPNDKSDDADKPLYDETKDACDENNFQCFNDEETVRI